MSNDRLYLYVQYCIGYTGLREGVHVVLAGMYGA